MSPDTYPSWLIWALLSAGFAALTAIFAKIGVKKGRDSRVSDVPAPPQPAEVTATGSTPLLMAQERELRAKLKELRDHIVKNADNVGERFPNEARKMHYGDIEHRPIYGEASPEEARALIDEGVEVSPIPVLPDDRN